VPVVEFVAVRRVPVVEFVAVRRVPVVEFVAVRRGCGWGILAGTP
jgi:hypothetical protein